jgi:NB-ARC domain
MDIDEVLKLTDDLVFAQTGMHLDYLQEEILKGTLQSKTYSEIAKELHLSKSHVRNTGSQLWKIMSKALKQDITKNSFKSIFKNRNLGRSSSLAINNNVGRDLAINHFNICPATARSPSDISSPDSSPNSSPNQNTSPIIDLIDAPELRDFYNRNTELNTLKQWILQDQIRLITIYGLSGIGKSLLTRQLIEQIKPEFDYIIWRSLTETPTLSSLKNQLQQFFAQSQQPPLPTIIDYFRNSRCLVILDDLQNLFQSGELAGQYLTEHKDYGQLWQQIAKNHHQSCVILLSWEKPRELATLEAENTANRTLHIKGLGEQAAELLRKKGLTDSEKWPELINLYQGHPTWLNIIASTILELFDGQVSLFLGKDDELFLEDLEPILESQLERLSKLEQQVICCFREREAIDLSQKPTNCELSQSELWSAMKSLGRRGLVEKISEGGRGLFQINRIFQEYIKL